MPGWLPWLLVGALRIEGSTVCPTPEEVAAQAGPMIAAPAERARPARRVVLDHDEAGALRIRQLDEEGQLVAERVLAPAPCPELALAAAVVIAAWEGGERADLPAARVPLPPAPAPAPAPPPAPALSLAPASPPAAAPIAARPSTARRVRVEVAAGVLGALAPVSPVSLAPGGFVEVSLGPPGDGLGGRLQLARHGPLSAPLSTGSAVWTRDTLTLGPRYRISGRRLRLDLSLDAVVALLELAGEGLSGARSAYDVDPGLGTTVRLGLRAGRFAPFVGASVVGWLRAQQADFAGDPVVSTTLPRVEILGMIGLAIGDL